MKIVVVIFLDLRVWKREENIVNFSLKIEWLVSLFIKGMYVVICYVLFWHAKKILHSFTLCGFTFPTTSTFPSHALWHFRFSTMSMFTANSMSIDLPSTYGNLIIPVNQPVSEDQITPTNKYGIKISSLEVKKDTK